MAGDVSKRRSHRIPSRPHSYLAACAAFLILSHSPVGNGLHHMKRTLPQEEDHREKRQANTPLIITNNCADDIYPGITTQSGTGPDSTGFKLSAGDQNKLTVSENWQGRVWGRTNCSFNDQGSGPSNNSPGKACGTGDCNGILNCKVTGDTPVTLAEFTLDAGDGQTYYDISLVDGYNLPMAIILEPLGNSSFMAIPPNLTSVSCVATAGMLASQDFNPYSGNPQDFLGTNSSNPLPFNTKTSDSDVANWCPWNLQVNAPTSPNDNVYTYPDTSIQRPLFDPCYSACAKWNSDADCCTGSYGSPSSCQPSEYSKAAKDVCPDAYSFGIYENHHRVSLLGAIRGRTMSFILWLISCFFTAFDDQTSTFVIPAGAGFQVIFCPGGRSTNIFSASAPLVSELANTGSVGSKRSAGKPNVQSERLPAERSQGASGGLGVGEPASLTWWLMLIGLALTASIFVLL